MKKVMNIVTGGEGSLSLVLAALNQPRDPQAGARYDEILATVPVVKKVTAALEADHVLLEQVEFDLVVEKIKLLPFQNNSPAVLEMLEGIINSDDVEVTETEEK